MTQRNNAPCSCISPCPSLETFCVLTAGFVLTYSDGVDFSLDLQGALVTLVSVDHLLQLGVADHQVLCPLMVLLQMEK